MHAPSIAVVSCALKGKRYHRDSHTKHECGNPNAPESSQPTNLNPVKILTVAFESVRKFFLFTQSTPPHLFHLSIVQLTSSPQNQLTFLFDDRCGRWLYSCSNLSEDQGDRMAIAVSASGRS